MVIQHTVHHMFSNEMLPIMIIIVVIKEEKM